MFLKVKFKHILGCTDKAIHLQQWQGGDIWLPLKCCFRTNKSNTKSVVFLVPDWLCKEKGFDGKVVESFHKPAKIEPKYNQEAIDELKC